MRPTSTGTLNWRTEAMCASRLSRPTRSAATSSLPTSGRGTPPWYLSALAVATIRAASGLSPAARHLMSKNFSAPRSVAKPASVRQMSPSLSAMRVAMTELQPWAMLAKGPPCTRAGVPSMVWTRFGWTASRSRAVMAPVTLSSSARTAPPSGLSATTMRPSRALRSPGFSARHRAAMISEAEVMRKPASRGTPSRRPPSPTTTLRSARSLTSRTRRHSTCRTSMPSALPWWRWLSTAAARRLWAEVIAWKSPVKWRLMSSIGTTWERPPPVPPPFMPSVGPIDGSRRAMTARAPMRARAWPRPMVMVVLPSPAGVGVIAVTTTSLPSGPARRERSAGSRTFALSQPYGSHSSAASPSSRAMSAIGRGEVGIRHDLLEPVGQRNHLRRGGVPAGMAREPRGHELLGLVADLVREGEARPLALADARGHFQQVVEPRGLDVFHERLHHGHVDARVYLGHRQAPLAQVLDSGDFEVGQVVAVIDDRHGIGVLVADADLRDRGHRAAILPPLRKIWGSGRSARRVHERGGERRGTPTCARGTGRSGSSRLSPGYGGSGRSAGEGPAW